RHHAQMPDATLMRLIMPTGLNRRSDKALAPHPTPCSVPDATQARLIIPAHCFYTDNFPPPFRTHSYKKYIPLRKRLLFIFR
ncbi:TPA: hypothetical protein ACW1B5_001110, partial [Escherichia coli]